jgi:8-oxo-dGTP pyrophosphatase MutT (NUDIX family)
MENQSEIIEQARLYLERYRSEKTRIDPFIQFVRSFDGVELIDRKNFVGHLTASAFIVNQKKNSLLLLKHKALQRWLQPGGHIDATDKSIIDAAFREASEETRLVKSSLKLLTPFIFDIDSHAIPANQKKQEPAHVHHDVRFLFLCDVSGDILFDEAESTGAQWVRFAELADNGNLKNVAQKVIEELK